MELNVVEDRFPTEKENLTSLLAINLSLTPEERMIQHQSALDLIQQLRLGMIKADEESQQTSTRK